MPLLVEPSAPPAPQEPEQGVIDDARRRQRRRRQRSLAALIVLAGIGGLAAAMIGGHHSHPPANANAEAASAAAIRARRAQAPTDVRLTPSLEGGSYGWCLSIHGGGTCPVIPTAGGGLQGGILVEPRSHTETITLLLPDEAVGILVDGQRVHAVTIASLPYHLRLAAVTIPRRGTPSTPAGNAPPPPGPPTPQSLLAINAQGRILRSPPTPAHEPGPRRVIWWARPTALPHGPCQIHAHGMPNLQPQWGHVATSITPYPQRIIGRAFYSCIDTEYYVHHWPLETAILLDAQHPGSTPAAIPGLTRVPAAAAFYNGPGDFRGGQTAIRKGNAWLVVAGGSGLAQRIEVLTHLTATVRTPAAVGR